MQIVLNYYDWEEPFIQSKKCYEVIRKHGKRVIVMEPVKGGALARVPSGAEHILKELDKNASPNSITIKVSVPHTILPLKREIIPKKRRKSAGRST